MAGPKEKESSLFCVVSFDRFMNAWNHFSSATAEYHYPEMSFALSGRLDCVNIHERD